MVIVGLSFSVISRSVWLTVNPVTVPAPTRTYSLESVSVPSKSVSSRGSILNDRVAEDIPSGIVIEPSEIGSVTSVTAASAKSFSV